MMRARRAALLLVLTPFWAYGMALRVAGAVVLTTGRALTESTDRLFTIATREPEAPEPRDLTDPYPSAVVSNLHATRLPQGESECLTTRSSKGFAP